MDLIAHNNHKSVNWHAIIIGSLAFWLSGSFLLDFIIIPSLSATGMMNEGGFASAGFVIFSIFNHIELVCAALVLIGALVFYFRHHLQDKKQFLWLTFSAILLLIPLAYTYLFTPNLSGWGLSLHQFGVSSEMPEQMLVWHGGYWFLEIVKYVLGITILRWCYQLQDSSNVIS